YAGYYAKWGKRFQSWFPDVTGLEWRRDRLTIVCVTCVVFFIPGYAYFQARSGSAITDVTELAAAKAVWHDDPSLSWMFRSVLIGLMPAFFLLAAALPSKRLSRIVLPIGYAAIMMFLVTRLGQRGYFAYTGLIIVML